MKEYIKLEQNNFEGFDSYIISYFKDDNHSIIHRENNKPAIIDEGGSRAYLRDGTYHRDNGPAYIICTRLF